MPKNEKTYDVIKLTLFRFKMPSVDANGLSLYYELHGNGQTRILFIIGN
jgi:hypothetical protein